MLSLTSVIAPATVLDVVAVKPFISNVPVTNVFEETNKDPPEIFVFVELKVVKPELVNATFETIVLAVI